MAQTEDCAISLIAGANQPALRQELKVLPTGRRIAGRHEAHGLDLADSAVSPYLEMCAAGRSKGSNFISNIRVVPSVWITS